MSAEQFGQSKTEQPTPKKLLDSRKKGQTARSRELNTTIMLLASSIALIAFGNDIGTSLQQLLASDLTINRLEMLNKEMLITRLGDATFDAIALLIPFFCVTLVASFVGPIALGGWSFSLDAMAPKWNRMSPLSGLKRMFGTQGLVEMIKALGKFIVIGVVAWFMLEINKDRILTLGSVATIDAIHGGILIIGQLFVALSLSLIIVSLIDVPYQLVSHVNRLKMSVQEVRDENKQTNGNPEIKNQIRSLQREVSSRRMLLDVAEADVVITNPTHYSIALKYEEGGSSAPLVVAKGTDFLAMRIREIANGNNVEIFSAPALARSLYQHTEVGQEVPTALYQAVAQVLAYVYQIRDLTRTQRNLVKRPDIVALPDDLQVASPDDQGADSA
ncbi:MAG: flagellar biosynthesis protein FlhB [Granulosicoccus sp.]|nr:flagellar biosynthesis protein FlhB [Granulosicoccus sp.]